MTAENRLATLSRTAAVMIVVNPNIAVLIGGTESKLQPVDVLAGIIEGVFASALEIRDSPLTTCEPGEHNSI